MDKRFDMTSRRWAAIAALITAVVVAPRFVSLVREAGTSRSGSIGAIAGLAASAVIIWLVVRRVSARGRTWRDAIAKHVAERRSAGDRVVEIAFVSIEVLATLHATAGAGDAIPGIRPGAIARIRDRSWVVVVVSSNDHDLCGTAFPFKGFEVGIPLLDAAWDEISSTEVRAHAEGLRSFDELVIHVVGWRSPLRLLMLAGIPGWTLKPIDPRPIAAELERIRDAVNQP